MRLSAESRYANELAVAGDFNGIFQLKNSVLAELDGKWF
jgi:hypothetical protein